MRNTPYIFTETAFHHEGDMAYLKQLVDMTKESGANGIKFQVLIDLNYLTSSKHSGFEQLKEFIFTREQWVEIFTYASAAGLDIIYMPLDLLAFDLLTEMSTKPKYLEIHPVCFYDEAIISHLKETKIPTIVGVGGRDEEEIARITEKLGSQLEVLMIGFQSFPSILEDVKIKRISYYKNKYPNLIIAYTDHSGFDDEYAVLSNDYALFLGATMFEKHITLDEGVERVDYNSAIGKDKLVQIIERLHFLSEKVLDISDEKLLSLDPPEMTYRNRQKVIVAAQDIREGQLISAEDLTFKMINKDKGSVDTQQFIGKKAKSLIEKDDIIRLADVS